MNDQRPEENTRVRYVGPPRDPGDSGVSRGEEGTVYVKCDHNGDTHIRWDRAGVEIWDAAQMRRVEAL